MVHVVEETEFETNPDCIKEVSRRCFPGGHERRTVHLVTSGLQSQKESILRSAVETNRAAGALWDGQSEGVEPGQQGRNLGSPS